MTKTLTPTAYVEASMGADFSWITSNGLSILTACPTVAAEVGSYTFRFDICLTDYSGVCTFFFSNFDVHACEITSFTMTSLSTYSKTYTVADPLLSWTIDIPGTLTTQTPAC